MFRAYVDGSYHKDLNVASYGVAIIDDENKIIDKYNGIINDKSLTTMHQIGGEIIAAVVATRLAYLQGESELEIFFDYAGTLGWAKLKKPWESNRKGTILYQDFMHYMQKEKGMKITFHKVHGSHSKSKNFEEETDQDVDALNDAVDEIAKAAFDLVGALKCRKNKEKENDIKSKICGLEIFDINTIDNEIEFKNEEE